MVTLRNSRKAVERGTSKSRKSTQGEMVLRRLIIRASPPWINGRKHWKTDLRKTEDGRESREGNPGGSLGSSKWREIAQVGIIRSSRITPEKLG